MKINPLLQCDWYKLVHHAQYPQGLTKMVSYYTPRMSRLDDVDHLTLFGLQGFICEYLEEAFNDYFFKRPWASIQWEYTYAWTEGMGTPPTEDDMKRIKALYDLGYLPLSIRAVPEGTRTKVGVPQIEISNTHPDFVWLVNAIETMLSCEMWHTQVAAEVGIRYYKIAKLWADRTCDSSVDPHTLISDFSMRGQHSVESATKASAAWALTNYGSATVPALFYLSEYYTDGDRTYVPNITKGAISTEHSVMCSNKAVDGDEITFIKRLLTEIYPDQSFSMVSDSYDYWNLVTNLLPQCKEEIMNHNGTLLVRGDSGNPVDILAGKKILWLTDKDTEVDKMFIDSRYTKRYLKDMLYDDYDVENEGEIEYYINLNGKFYHVTCNPEFSSERGGYTDNKYYFVEDWDIEWKEIQPDAELLGTVWALDQICGHTINEKGYKVLDRHIKAIYGDSIIPDYAREIYRRLAAQGYAANNVALGAGSMGMMALVCQNDEGNLQFAGRVNGTNPGPYTRDTFGIAVKATYCEDKDGNPINIYKQPKALAWKKSQKGCCIVAMDGESYTDEHTFEEATKSENLLREVWRDGKFVEFQELDKIRATVERDLYK